MAATSIRTTYALDAETVARLERLARDWKLSKSAVLRKLIREAEPAAGAHDADPRLAALHALQRLNRLSPRQAEEWARETRRERAASSQERLARLGQS